MSYDEEPKKEVVHTGAKGGGKRRLGMAVMLSPLLMDQHPLLGAPKRAVYPNRAERRAAGKRRKDKKP